MKNSTNEKTFISRPAFDLLQKLRYDTLYEWIDFDELLLDALHEAGHLAKSVDMYGTHFSVLRDRG